MEDSSVDSCCWPTTPQPFIAFLRPNGRYWCALDTSSDGSQTSVRAKVEHVFGIIKRVFGFQKVCYRGLAKNLHRLEATAALANLFLVRRRLLNA